ncbi:hypothetical protein Tco_1309802 [Tanacetum coccineum]
MNHNQESSQQSFKLLTKPKTHEEEEPGPDPTSKITAPEKSAYSLWTQGAELLLAGDGDLPSQVSWDQKKVRIQSKDTFWYKVIGCLQQGSQKRLKYPKSFQEHDYRESDTPMNRVVRTAQVEKSRLDKRQGRNRIGLRRGPRAFGLPTPCQANGNVPESKRANLERKMKQDVLERESRARVDLLESQKIAEDMRVLTMDTSSLDPMNAAIVKAQQARIRAKYPTQ